MSSLKKRVSIRLFQVHVFLILYFCFNGSVSLAQDNDSSDFKVPEPGPVNFTSAPASKAEAISQLQTIIEKDYQHWTGSRSRPLTLQTIGRLQANPQVKYGQAVLLGVLALTIDHAHGMIDRLDYDAVMALANGDTIHIRTSPDLSGNAMVSSDAESFAFRNLVTNYRKFFKNLLSNITESGYSLWGKENSPCIDGLQQGPVGDCYWLSAVEAVVQNQPELVRQTIRQLGPDKFELKFCGRKDPVVVTLTHGSMSQLSLDPQQGCWLTILALGEAKIRDQEPNLPDFWRLTPLGVVAHSGSQKQVLELLTGQKYLSVHLRQASQERIDAILSRSRQNRMPVGLCTADHCLSLCDYNKDAKILTILNPAGSSDRYHIGASEINVIMENGIFELALPDACRAFSSLSIPAAAASDRE